MVQMRLLNCGGASDVSSKDRGLGPAGARLQGACRITAGEAAHVRKIAGPAEARALHPHRERVVGWHENEEFCNAFYSMPPWPNGQGVGFLIRRLRVRVPQGVRLILPRSVWECCVALLPLVWSCILVWRTCPQVVAGHSWGATWVNARLLAGLR